MTRSPLVDSQRTIVTRCIASATHQSNFATSIPAPGPRPYGRTPRALILPGRPTFGTAGRGGGWFAPTGGVVKLRQAISMGDKKGRAVPGLFIPNEDRRQAAWMFEACLPFGPGVTSKLTFWPSLSVLKPGMLIAEK